MKPHFPVPQNTSQSPAVKTAHRSVDHRYDFLADNVLTMSGKPCRAAKSDDTFRTAPIRRFRSLPSLVSYYFLFRFFNEPFKAQPHRSVCVAMCLSVLRGVFLYRSSHTHTHIHKDSFYEAHLIIHRWMNIITPQLDFFYCQAIVWARETPIEETFVPHFSQVGVVIAFRLKIF